MYFPAKPECAVIRNYPDQASAREEQFSILCSRASDNFLQGTWQSAVTPLPKRHAVQGSLEFRNGEFSSVHTLYADARGTILNLLVLSEGTYQVNLNTISMHPNSVTMLIVNPAVVPFYNEHKVAGYGDWRLGVPKDVAGRDCGPFPLLPANTETVYALTSTPDTQTVTIGDFPSVGLAPHHPSLTYLRVGQ